MKVGVSIITCNRAEMFSKLVESLPSGKFDEFVVVNDGDPIPHKSDRFSIETGGVGVGAAKNAALKYLLDRGCDYIFLIEDDMLIKRADIFDAYITASKRTGIQHFLFAYHGPANKNNISGGPPSPRVIVEYPGGVRISLNQHCVGAFCMYTKESLENVGLFDTKFHNAFEHVHHSYLLCKQNFCTEYWWWPDLANSLDYIEEQACSEHNSTIRPRSDWQDNIKKGFKHFIEVEGISPVQIIDKPFSEVRAKLQLLTGL